jgi:undecaprenol kinase
MEAMRRFWKSLEHARDGFLHAFRRERNFRIHIVTMVVAIAAGIYLNITVAAWGLVIFSIGFVLTAELFNTAIERLSDQVANGDHKSLIKQAKDVSAAAVLVSALTALIIGILFLIIPLVDKIVDLING